MKKYTILIILGLVVLSACEENIILSSEQMDQIRVVGTASINTAPDIAIAQIGVQTFNKEVEPAVAENNKKTEAIIESIVQQGVERKDIQTSRFNIYPQRDYKNDRPEVIIGFQVDNSVSVTMRNLDAVGKILQAAITAGANNISGVSFTIEDPEPFMNDARAKAIENALQRAKIMADAAEIELGKVININELSQSGYTVMRADYDKAAAESAVPIEPGELELTVQIEVVFAIE